MCFVGTTGQGQRGPMFSTIYMSQARLFRVLYRFEFGTKRGLERIAIEEQDPNGYEHEQEKSEVVSSELFFAVVHKPWLRN